LLNTDKDISSTPYTTQKAQFFAPFVFCSGTLGFECLLIKLRNLADGSIKIRRNQKLSNINL